ncbi:GNAT family N-acetyltransferase [Sphingomonas endolithica]|uniref:GNAT family N-acetyltransferase n=1 Tax=Sphingomonas endolithica TaxID=2972485 RepID=UPI0021AE7D65|nr:GNAT family N-acetyltransferase [Sphingomonas sp. ZFBP2030]
MIETARLILRAPTPADRPALYAMWGDPRVMENLAPVCDAAGAEAILARHDAVRPQGLGFSVVERKEDDAMLGFCGLKRGNPGSPIEGQLEIGWVFARQSWGHGCATEAAQASLDWGWAHLTENRIIAITAARNLASQRVMHRLGMIRVADGDFDHPMFAIGDPLRATVTYEITRPA